MGQLRPRLSSQLYASHIDSSESGSRPNTLILPLVRGLAICVLAVNICILVRRRACLPLRTFHLFDPPLTLTSFFEITHRRTRPELVSNGLCMTLEDARTDTGLAGWFGW